MGALCAAESFGTANRTNPFRPRRCQASPSETAIGYRDGPRGENLRPKLHLLSHRELVSGPFGHSKCPEVDRSLLARAPEYGTHSLQAQRRYVQGVAAAF